MRTFSPAEVEEYTGWTTQSLRDLRNKRHLTKSGVPINYGDLLSNYGELQPNGRWTYSLRDLVAFWIARALNENYQDPFASFLPGVFAVSYSNAETVVGFAKGQSPREGWTAILHSLTPNRFGAHGGSVVNLPRIEDLENNPNPNVDLSFHKADVFNWKHFADTMPAALKSLVLES